MTTPGRKATISLGFALAACSPDIIEAPGDEVAESGTTDDEVGTDTSATESGSSDSSSDDTDASTSSSSSDETDSSTSTGPDTTTDDTSTTETTEGPSDCFSNDDCELGNCLDGDCIVVASCKQLADLDLGDTLPDGVYELDPDADGPRPPYDAYCDMTSKGGGWTLVLKSNGNLDTFVYEALHWTSPDPFQPQFPDLDRNEAKLTSYAAVPFTEVRVGMESPIGVDPAPLALNWVDLPVVGNSLHELIVPGTLVQTAIGRDLWKSLIGGSSLQLECNLEGLNVMPSGDLMNSRVRIGIVANEQADCNSPNTRLGIGGGGSKCGALPNPTGNFGGCMADNGDVNILAYAAVLVR